MNRILRSSLPSSRRADSRRGFSFSPSRITSRITALTIWESTVARATPTTPMRNTTTSSTSMRIFVRQAAIRDRTGLLESPMARKMPASILYTMEARAPAK